MSKYTWTRCLIVIARITAIGFFWASLGALICRIILCGISFERVIAAIACTFIALIFLLWQAID